MFSDLISLAMILRYFYTYKFFCISDTSIFFRLLCISKLSLTLYDFTFISIDTFVSPD